MPYGLHFGVLWNKVSETSTICPIDAEFLESSDGINLTLLQGGSEYVLKAKENAERKCLANQPSAQVGLSAIMGSVTKIKMSVESTNFFPFSSLNSLSIKYFGDGTRMGFGLNH